MGLFHKECDVCGKRINKFQNFVNVYLLKTGIKVKCANCNTEYKTNKAISSLAYFYTWGGLWLAPLILIVYLIDSFELDLGFEVWLYALIIYTIFEFIVMVYLPLKIIDDKE